MFLCYLVFKDQAAVFVRGRLCNLHNLDSAVNHFFFDQGFFLPKQNRPVKRKRVYTSLTHEGQEVKLLKSAKHNLGKATLAKLDDVLSGTGKLKQIVGDLLSIHLNTTLINGSATFAV